MINEDSFYHQVLEGLQKQVNYYKFKINNNIHIYLYITY